MLIKELSIEIIFKIKWLRITCEIHADSICSIITDGKYVNIWIFSKKIMR